MTHGHDSCPRFGKYLPDLTAKMVEDHDMSRFTVVELTGYTDRYVGERKQK